MCTVSQKNSGFSLGIKACVASEFSQCGAAALSINGFKHLTPDPSSVGEQN